jgi:hypothetical protein
VKGVPLSPGNEAEEGQKVCFRSESVSPMLDLKPCPLSQEDWSLNLLHKKNFEAILKVARGS